MASRSTTNSINALFAELGTEYPDVTFVGACDS